MSALLYSKGHLVSSKVFNKGNQGTTCNIWKLVFYVKRNDLNTIHIDWDFDRVMKSYYVQQHLFIAD